MLLNNISYIQLQWTFPDVFPHWSSCRRNGRITVCFVALKGDPVILRLYGRASCKARHVLEAKAASNGQIMSDSKSGNAIFVDENWVNRAKPYVNQCES